MSAYDKGKPVNLLRAWEQLGAKPDNIRSWSAWDDKFTTLYVTLPLNDVREDGRTITLWDSAWRKKNRRVNPRSREQLVHLLDAIAFNKPIYGFLVLMRESNAEKTKETYPDRLLRMTIIENTHWGIVARADGRINP